MRTLVPFSRSETIRSISWTAMFSVIATTSGRSLSRASRSASAALAGGTKMIVAFAPVAATAWSTVSNNGTPSWVVPPLPGFVAPTTAVP